MLGVVASSPILEDAGGLRPLTTDWGSGIGTPLNPLQPTQLREQST